MAISIQNRKKFDEAMSATAASRPTQRATFPDADGFTNLPQQEISLDDQDAIDSTYSGIDPSYEPASFDESLSVASASRARLVTSTEATRIQDRPYTAMIPGLSTPTITPPDTPMHSDDSQSTLIRSRQERRRHIARHPGLGDTYPTRSSRQLMLDARRRRGVSNRLPTDVEIFFFPTDADPLTVYVENRGQNWEDSQRRVTQTRSTTGNHRPRTRPASNHNGHGYPYGTERSNNWPDHDRRERLEQAWERSRPEAHQEWRDPHRDAWQEDAWQEDPWQADHLASHWHTDASSAGSGWNAREGWDRDDAARNPPTQRNYTTASTSHQDVHMHDAPRRLPATPYDDSVADWPDADDI
jgi:hypothetical protein